MERPEPKFVPGERVLIASKMEPGFNGVHAIVLHVEWRICHHVITRELNEGWKYKTDPMTDSANWWNQNALRKLDGDTPAQFDASIWQPKEEIV